MSLMPAKTCRSGHRRATRVTSANRSFACLTARPASPTPPVDFLPVGKDDVREGFGAWLKQTRRTAGFPTPSALGRETGIDQSLIAKWEADKAQPGIANLRRLARVLPGVTVVDLMVRAGHLEPEEVGMSSLPETPAPALDPDLEGIQAWLDDARVPEERKTAAREYLRFLREQRTAS